MMGEGPGFTQRSGKLFFLHSYKIIIPGRGKKGSGSMIDLQDRRALFCFTWLLNPHSIHVDNTIGGQDQRLSSSI